MANRHLSRSIVLQTLFELDFLPAQAGSPDDKRNNPTGEEIKDALKRNLKEFAPGFEDDDFVYSLLEKILKKHFPNILLNPNSNIVSKLFSSFILFFITSSVFIAFNPASTIFSAFWRFSFIASSAKFLIHFFSILFYLTRFIILPPSKP